MMTLALPMLTAAFLALAGDPVPSTTASPSKPNDGAQSSAANPKAAEEGFGAVKTPDLVTRVGGDKEALVEVRAEVYSCGPCSIESPLPNGYPEPTPPGSIDIKRYPSVRRAEFRQESARGMNGRMNAGFWPLFNHISRNEIPMTSPVEIEFDGVFNDLASFAPQPDGAWTMSFLYRAKELGPVGEDGSVKVVDTPEVTVVSVGLRGAYGMDVTREGVKLLKPWLDGQTEWEIADEPRVFHYNGPSVRDANKWSEVQIPIRKRVAEVAAPAAVGVAEGLPQSSPAASR
jgi:SOUL heme-binding protein